MIGTPDHATPPTPDDLYAEYYLTHPDGTPYEYRDYLADGVEMWGYRHIAERTNRRVQSMRKALMERNKRVKATGAADRLDIPEPACYFGPAQKAQPYWPAQALIRWAQMTGKLELDGVTPIRPKTGRLGPHWNVAA